MLRTRKTPVALTVVGILQLIAVTAGREVAAAEVLSKLVSHRRQVSRTAPGQAAAVTEGSVPCAAPDALQDALKPISQISLDITPSEKGRLPNPCDELWQGTRDPAGVGASRSEFYHDFYWAPSELVHNPLYFEDVPLERYGQTRLPILQPAVSGLRFLKSTVTLPYRIGLDPPCKLVYTLGYDRPGSCAASVREHLPWSWRGAALQTGAVVGGLYMFPLY